MAVESGNGDAPNDENTAHVEDFTAADILDTVDVPIVVIALDCTISRFNRAASNVLKLQPSDLGRPAGEALSVVPNLDRCCTEVVVTGLHNRHEIRVGDRFFLVRFAPFHGTDRQVREVVVTLTNVTAFRASIEQAIYEREYTKAILNTTAEPLVVLNDALRIQTANQAFYTMFECSRADSADLPIFELSPAEWQAPALWDSLRSALSGDAYVNTVEIERRFPATGGRTLLVDVRRLPHKGDALLLLGFRDITDRVRQARALQAANAALQLANEDLQHFAYSASHDLQEPLRTIAIYCQLLQKQYSGTLDVDGERFLQFVVEGARRMQDLLRNLRIYLHISAADSAPLSVTDANQALHNALLNLKVAIEETGASVTSSDLPRLKMQSGQLELLFQNLITNAIRYRSDLPPQIRVAAARHADEWVFSVQDNGVGIEPRYHEYIFGLFKRLEARTADTGSGIGLAISQRITARAGGRIWVESAPGVGSTFSFAIPDTNPLADMVR